MTSRIVLLLAAVLAACAHRGPRWESYANAGPLPVRGARSTAAGPTALRALADDPDLRRIVAANGDPDTLEVITVPGGRRRIVLTYPPSRDGRPRRITVGPRPAEPVARAPKARPARQADALDPPATAATPSTRQRLECPIDPDRADCRALCATATKHEWCP
jgi:hypothetical protein